MRTTTDARQADASSALLSRGRQERGARVRWCSMTACLLALGGCGEPSAAPSPPGPAERPEFITYEGLVFEPRGSGRHARYWGPEGVTGIPGFTVTIIGGQPDGWTAETDAEGRFYFEDYPFCLLHTAECRSRRFRVEKAGYQTREVGASDGYLWVSSSRQDREWSAYEKRIDVSREWPADPQVQRMLRELPAISPLWLLERPDHYAAGSYGGGLAVVRSLEDTGAVAHEYCHAHQDWVVDPDQYNGLGEYARTEAGHAFDIAWEADSETGDGNRFINGYSPRGPVERAAEVCAWYFVDAWRVYPWASPTYLRDRLPHLYAWAEEWLR